MNITYHQDPGHGWLEVPLQTLADLDIAQRVSAYSYVNRPAGLAYLEEDCDAALFMDAAKARGIQIRLDERHTNHDSFIRGLRSYRG